MSRADGGMALWMSRTTAPAVSLCTSDTTSSLRRRGPSVRALTQWAFRSCNCARDFTPRDESLKPERAEPLWWPSRPTHGVRCFEIVRTIARSLSQRSRPTLAGRSETFEGIAPRGCERWLQQETAIPEHTFKTES